VNETCARFVSGSLAHGGWRADGQVIALDTPRAVHVATRLEDVVGVLAEADHAAARGEWAAVMVAYEAAAAFDAAMPRDARPRRADAVPLAWVAVCPDVPGTLHLPRMPSGATLRPAPVAAAPWQPALSREAFGDAMARVLELIAAGDTYQVNFTFPLTREGRGPLESADYDVWLDALCRAHDAGYGARLDLGRHVVLSASPELFVERRGDRLRARPMKGTSPRGRWLEEDTALRDALVASEKARAENVMIVDLLRNDLGRIAETGSVQVPALFTPEAYPTVWQLTSTIEARLPQPSTGVVDLFRALFPCGSVTGAPKISTMGIIAELEPAARGVYTGAIGFVAPGGDAVFSVAIRTIVVERATGAATLGVGAGIVADSRADDEYDECLLKAAFAAGDDPGVSGHDPGVRAPRPLSPVAAAVVRVPPPAQRDFELLETVRVESGVWQHLARHLARMAASARYFGFPWNREAVEAAVATSAVLPGVSRGRIRLLPTGEVAIEVLPLSPLPEPRRVALAKAPVDPNEVFLCHKTTRRDVYTAARLSRPDVDDVILWNTRGEVTESTIANVIVEIDGVRWTPPRTCGLLAGIGRGLLLDADMVRERLMTTADVKAATRLSLVSALRGETPATLIPRT
jgi:para-aminobenzoate synthetase/4-amino-4-deoxychorismate lyase